MTGPCAITERSRPAQGLFLRNVASNLLGQGLVMLLVVAAGRELFRSMGGEAFGVVFFALTLSTTLAAAFDLGIGATVVREVAASHAQDPDYVSSLARTAGLLCWASYGVLAILMVGATPVLAHGWVSLATLDPARASGAMRIVALGGLLALPRSLYTAVLRGLERMDLSNGIDVASMALQQAGTVLLARQGASLEAVVAWLAVSQAGWCVGLAAAVARLRGLSWLKPAWHGATVRRNLGFSGHLTLVSVLAVVQAQADRLIASYLLPVASFGYYAFGFGGVARITLLTGALANAVYPSFAALVAGGGGPRLAARYHLMQEFLCLANAPLFAAVPFLALPLGTFVFGAEVARLLVFPLGLVALGFYMNGTLTLPHVYCLAAGRPDISARLNLLALAVVLPTSALLIAYVGLAGAGLSWVVYHVFAYAYAVPRMSRECLGIPVRRWFHPTLKAVSIAAATYAPAFAWAWLVAPRGPWLLYAYLAASVAYVAAAALWAGPEVRASVLSLRSHWPLATAEH